MAGKRKAAIAPVQKIGRLRLFTLDACIEIQQQLQGIVGHPVIVPYGIRSERGLIPIYSRPAGIPENTVPPLPIEDTHNADRLHTIIADGLRRDGYAICRGALPSSHTDALSQHLMQMDGSLYHPAGIGRQQEHSRTRAVRRDEICWIAGESPAGRAWLDWAMALQQSLNRSLLLGLFSFESHFAHYRPGAFYRRHLDAFRGEANRVLSLVAYLNPDWRPDDGGQLVLYPGNGEPVTVLPELGTVAVFLSEEFPHEVLPARRDRYSITGWFRVNTSTGGRVDPPN